MTDQPTAISQRRLTELRHTARTQSAAASSFVNPHTIHAALDILDRRGEPWAAQILGRDLTRRSHANPLRPYLHTGDATILVLADAEEDTLAIAHLDH